MACLAAIILGVLPEPARQAARERVFDALLTLAAPLRTPPAGTRAAPLFPIVVVDIDTRALAARGPWPWPRERMAALVDAARRSGAAAIAIDILFDGPDTRSPAALARRLGAAAGRPDLAALADTLPDGDRALADALAAATLASAPVALGFALDPNGAAEIPAPPFLTAGGSIPLPGLWRMGGGIAPFGALLDQAAGIGVLALPGDEDGLIRRVPLLTGVAGRAHPGLALEALRLAEGASAYRLDGVAGTIGMGGVVVPLPPDGMLRLVPARTMGAFVTTIPAADLLTREAPDPRMRGAIVLIGGSAPELGGLRATPDDPLVPSVLLHAAAVAQLSRGLVPLPMPRAAALLWACGLIAAGAGVLAASRARPLWGACAVLGFAVLCAALAVAAAARDRLFDPTPSVLLAVTAFTTTALMLAAETRRRETRIRERFAQHLAPAVVALIAASPSVLKLRGERREVTALFTDVEGFTAMTHRAEPETLVAVLDAYFEGVATIVIAHGGMIDKLVGDAVHAFFNMPLDLPDHPMRAVRCAIAIQAWTETYQRRSLPKALGFGRTRIGIETGPAIVGDIGLRAKLDYTAHGDTVNAAARFEAANKEIGSAICAGPGTAARCPPEALRPTGMLWPRGFTGPVRVFEPWPADADPAWRAGYLAAMALADADPAAASEMFLALAGTRPRDTVSSTLARRLLEQARADDTSLTRHGKGPG